MQQQDHFHPFRFNADDGLALHGRVYGDRGEGRPIVCLAGLSRNGRDFHPLATILRADGRS